MEKSNSHFEQKPNENYHLQLRQLGALIEETERYLDDARRQFGTIQNEFNNARDAVYRWEVRLKKLHESKEWLNPTDAEKAAGFLTDGYTKKEGEKNDS